MLTRELAIAEYRNGQVIPDRLNKIQHAQYQTYAIEMIRIYQTGSGLTRKDLHRAVHQLFANEENCPPKRIDAFCKLLDEVSTFDGDMSRKAAKLRQEVFRVAAKYHPLVQSADTMFEHQESKAKDRIADELGMTWPAIDGLLFSDLIEQHRLRSFQGYGESHQLLSRYNVAQTQAVLYDALSMTVTATRDFKSILRYAKLAGLMHTIESIGQDAYRFHFDGPASLHDSTRRYGVKMAKLLPGLLSCRGWEMVARLNPYPWPGEIKFTLSERCGLSSSVASPPEFDSKVEEQFFRQWNQEPRDHWRLERERRVLHAGQHVFVPDFEFVHSDGRRALMEVIGFWTPEYLEHKIQTLETFQSEKIVLAVQDSLRKSIRPELGTVVVYKKSISPADVLHVLSRNWKLP